MSNVTFHIDKEESENTGSLVIATSVPFSYDKIKGVMKHKETIAFLYEQEMQFQNKVKGKKSIPSDVFFSRFHVSYPQTIQALRLLAATGELYFRNNKLVCDLFGK